MIADQRLRETLNPAARLLAFVERGRKLPGNVEIETIWPKLLDCEDDPVQLYQRYAEIVKIPSQISEVLTRLAVMDVKIASDCIGNVHRAITGVGFKAPWAQFMNCFDDKTMTALQMISSMIDSGIQKLSPNIAAIIELRTEIAELQEQVTGAEINAELRNFILDKLELLDRVLIESIWAEPGKETASFEQLVGRIVLNENLSRESKKSPIGGKLWTLISRVADLLQFATAIQQLTSARAPLLPEALVN